jgi:hypothetical protein
MGSALPFQRTTVKPSEGGLIVFLVDGAPKQITIIIGGIMPTKTKKIYRYVNGSENVNEPCNWLFFQIGSSGQIKPLICNNLLKQQSEEEIQAGNVFNCKKTGERCIAWKILKCHCSHDNVHFSAGNFDGMKALECENLDVEGLVKGNVKFNVVAVNPQDPEYSEDAFKEMKDYMTS